MSLEKQAEAHAGRVRFLLHAERVAEVLAEQDADASPRRRRSPAGAALRAAGRENDGGAGNEANSPGDDADLVVADLDDQAPRRCRRRSQRRVLPQRRARGSQTTPSAVTEDRLHRGTRSDLLVHPWRGRTRRRGQRVPIGRRNKQGSRLPHPQRATACGPPRPPPRKPEFPNGRLAAGEAERLGREPPARRVTRGSNVHSSSKPSAREARICPPSQLGPTPLPE